MTEPFTPAGAGLVPAPAELLERITDAFIALDLEWRFVYLNAAAERMIGRPREDLLGAVVWDTFPSLVGTIHELHCRQAMAEQRPRQYEGYYPIFDGWYEKRLFPSAEGMTLYMHDISDRKRAERERAAFQERLSHAQRAAGFGIFDWDMVRDLPGWSPELEELYEVAPGAGGAEAWFERVHPDDVAAAAAACERAKVTGEIDAEWRVVLPDGRVRRVRTRGRASRDADGNPTRMIGIATDITERTALEEQLRQAQKMEAVGRLAGGVAHDFNNLLTVITGYSDVVASALAPDDALRRDVNEIRRAADRAALLTQQLLAFSRKQVVHPQVIDLNALVREMSGMLGRLLGADVSLQLDLAPNGCAILADSGQLHQVLMNLAVNARDAMPYGGTLTVRTRARDLDAREATALGLPAGPWSDLVVEDTGCGMPPDVRARMFEPFFTTKPMGKGTGLGLATVYGIVQQSRGHIRVDTAEGKGTTFSLSFPRVGKPAPPDPAAPAPEAPGGTETLLLVEDDEALRRLTSRSLERKGYRLLVAAGATDALRLCRDFSGEIDLLVTDVVMAGLSGPELAARVWSARPAVRVLYISGHSGDAIARQGTLEPGMAFLQKPFTPDELAACVRQTLDGGTTD